VTGGRDPDYLVGLLRKAARYMLRVGGRTFRLRRRGGKAYDDPVLAGLVGRTITGEGTVHGHALILDRWTVEKS
jgi:hypothetical protein